MLKLIIFGSIIVATVASNEYHIEKIGGPTVGFGNAPHWDDERNCIYYTDAFPPPDSPQIFRYDIDKNEFYSANVKHKQSASAACCIPIKGEKDLFMVGLNRCIYIVRWDGYSSEAYKMKKVFCAETQYPGHYFGRAKCDPRGRLYIGTYTNTTCDPREAPSCALYSYDGHQGLRKRVPGLRVSSGLAWGVKGNCFYHIESCFRNIREFSWDPRTGELSNPRVVYNFNDLHDNEYPVGMTVNDEGLLFVPINRRGEVYVICPKISRRLYKIKLPAKNVCSVMIVRKKLYVLTGSVNGDFRTSTASISYSNSPYEGKIYAVKSRDTKSCSDSVKFRF